jgi:hypothetical protein
MSESSNLPPGFDGIIPDAPAPVKSLKSWSDQARKNKIGAICNNIKLNLRPESACWAAGVDPEELAEYMHENPEIKRKINQALAWAERDLVQQVRKGGKSTDPARAALLVLRGTFTHWNKRSNVNLAAQLDDALRELRKRLIGDMSGEQAMKIVLDVLSRA